jgi:NTE family protein
MHQPPDRKPDELWIIQINAQELAGEPTSVNRLGVKSSENLRFS